MRAGLGTVNRWTPRSVWAFGDNRATAPHLPKTRLLLRSLNLCPQLIFRAEQERAKQGKSCSFSQLPWIRWNKSPGLRVIKTITYSALIRKRVSFHTLSKERWRELFVYAGTPIDYKWPRQNGRQGSNLLGTFLTKRFTYNNQTSERCMFGSLNTMFV